MSSYLMDGTREIKRQGGDSFDVSFIVPEQYYMDDKIPTFSIYRNDGSLIVSRTGVENMNIEKRIIFFQFSPDDLKRDWGKHTYELQLSTADKKTVHTVAAGTFIYTKERIR